MSYAQFSTIQASDFNTLVGGDPTTSSGTLNAVWATGGTNTGYGQTAVANVAVGDTVTAANWANLVNKTANCASHQGTSITSVTAPTAGGTVAYLSAIPTNLTTVYTSRLNAASQGATTSNSMVFGSTWSTAVTFTHTISFANANAARYFFNAGGQLKVSCSHANNTAGVNFLLNGLASNIGTVVLSAPISGTITVAGTSYNGVTKIGGGNPTPANLNTNYGFYAFTTSSTNVFQQTCAAGLSPSGYLGTFINIKANTNATANVITIVTTWDEVPNGLTAGTGSTTTVAAVAPETTYLSSSWGTITVTGTAA